jgi:signal transduction histidine kinase
MTALVQRLLRSRWAWPSAVVLAAGTLGLNELSHRAVQVNGEAAKASQEASMTVQRLMAAAANHEISYRGLAGTGDEVFRQRFDASGAAMDRDLRLLQQRYETLEPQLKNTFDHWVDVLGERRQDMRNVLRLRDDGKADQAVAALNAEVARRLSDSTPALEQKLLALESRLQQSADQSQRSAMLQGRLAVVAATALALLGLALWRQQALRLHREDLQQQLQQASERSRLALAVEQRTQELRALTRHQLTLREDERAALARELHDELGALLTAAKLDAARLKSTLSAAPEPLARLGALTAKLNDGIALKSRIVEDLRPSSLDHLGLKAALTVLCGDMQARLGFPIDVVLEDASPAPDIALTIYRLVQEALTNIAKHAQATQVGVRLMRWTGETYVEVRDNGVGFDAQNIPVGHHGLTGMHFRVASHGGAMRLQSQAGDTIVSATIPDAVTHALTDPITTATFNEPAGA